MKISKLSTIVLLSLSVNLYSQSFYTTQMFDYLEPNRISSGYLLDKGFDYVDFGLFDGTSLTDNNIATLFTFRNYLLSLNASRASGSIPWYNANEIVSSMMSGSGVTIDIAFFKHEYLVGNAISGNLVTQQNGVLLDYYQQGEWVNPYGISYSLIFAPGKLVHDGLNVTYSIGNGGQLFTNSSSLISYVQFDAGDGNGYVNISSSFPYSVSYSTGGTKELKVRVVLTDGRILQSHSQILITNTPLYSLFHPGADGSIYFSKQCEYSDDVVSAWVTYKYATGNYNKVRKPFIYVEGFDDRVLGILSSDDSLYVKIARLLLNVTKNVWSYNEPDSSSLEAQYDYFYVDWVNPRADIRDNAELLETIISDINGMKASDGTAERNIVMGHSMGGVIARYALCDMEEQGIDHETDYYISHDSPHLGANVPVGIQYAVRHAYSFVYGTSTTPGLLDTCYFKNTVDRIISALDAPSARQMMYHYVSPDGLVDNSMHSEWTGILSQKGFPKGFPLHPIDNIAIVNGGPRTGDTTSPLLSVQLNSGVPPLSNYSFILNLLGLHNIEVSLYAYVNSSVQLVEEDVLKYIKKHLFQDSVVSYSSHYHNSPFGYEYDFSPGSFFGDSVIAYSGINGRTDFTFIPESSALATVSSNNTHYTYNDLTPYNNTPFSSFYVYDDTYQHMSKPNDMSTWLTNQLGMSISGPEGVALSGDTFTTSGLGGTFTSPSWTSSDTSTATIDAYGEINVVDSDMFGDFIRISASCNDGTYYHHKHKMLFAGFPRMTLSSQVIDIAHTRVVASCIDTTLNVYLDSLASRGIISYKWGTPQLGGTIQWLGETSSRSYEFLGALDSEYLMKIVNGPGRESAVIHTPSAQFIDFFAYGFSPNIILVSDDSVYLYYNDIQDPAYGTSNANSYAAVWITNGHEGSTIPDNLYIDGQSLPVVATTQQSINGQSKTLYCFNILNSTKVQSGISAIRAGTAPPIGYIVRGYLRNGTTNLQQITISLSEL